MSELVKNDYLSKKIHKNVRNSVWKRIKDQKYLFIMLAPLILAVTIFRYLPIAGWIIAFKDYQIGVSVWDVDWVGFENIMKFFGKAGDAAYVIKNTVFINVLSLAGNLIFSCITAVLFNELVFKRFKIVVQTATFFPFFISWVIIYSVFSSFLSVNTGVINMMLVNSGVIPEGLNILGDAKYSWPLMIFVNIWRSLGYNTVIFLAQITAIDQAQYESAEIDGAGRFAKIIYITLPGIASTFAVLLILNSGWIFTVNFEQFFLFTNMTNFETMEVFDMYIYKYGLKLLDYPYATAVGIVKTAISIILLIIVNSISKKFAQKSIF